jgi:hypothetical protein
MENPTHSTTPQTQEEFMSLFDYLGRAAGTELGKEVHTEAKKQNVPMQTKDVSTPNYTGKVMMYPKNFLDKYFSTASTTNSEAPINSSSPDDLPF